MLKIKNKYLAPIINFLDTVELSPKASRCRTKFIKRLMTKHEEFSEDEMALVELYGQRDAAGELLRDENSYKLIPEKSTECVAEQTKLLNEEVAINLDELTDQMDCLTKSLGELDTKLSGDHARAYDKLMDALEKEEEN